MKIALDYDKTFTLDPFFWGGVVDLADECGHEIKIVTARHPGKDNIDKKIDGVPVIYCDGIAKKFFCHHVAFWDPDVWIDDKPENILQNGALSRDQLEEWRKSSEHDV